MFKKVSIEEAVALIKDGSTVGISGFMGSACPEYVLKNMEESFLNSGHPCDRVCGMFYYYKSGKSAGGRFLAGGAGRAVRVRNRDGGKYRHDPI